MTLEVDLHGLTVDEGLRELERTIDNAWASGENRLKIIHGKGTGRLRSAVWKYLREDKRVGRFEMDPAALDGTGATVVQLK